MNIRTFFLITLNGIFISAASQFTEDQMLNYVKQFLPKSPIILEAGGRFGQDTKRMKTWWEHAQVHVFEALPSTFKTLVNNTEQLSDVICYPYALSNHTGKTRFYVHKFNVGASSIDGPVSFNAHGFNPKPIEVSCITINDWARNNNISQVDFIWFDMEGHELYALQHASNILKTVKAIYTEVHFIETREGCGLYSDLKDFLESHGFCEVMKRFAPRTDIFGDCLFVKDELLDKSKNLSQN